MTLDLDAPAADMARIAAEIRDDQLDDPTPCPDIDVRGMLAHVLGLSVGFRDAARKLEGPTTSTPPGPAKLPHDWRAQLPHRLSELVAAWREPSAWEGEATVGGVTSPAAQTAAFGNNELIVHGWDLAVATGQPLLPAEPNLVASYRLASSIPDDPEARDGGLFGPRVPVSDDASLLERTLAAAGRGPALAAGLGPDLGVQEVLAAVQVTGIGTGGEILPTAVGDDQHDVRGFTDASRPRGLSQAGVQHRAGGKPREDAFAVKQLPDPANGIPGADREPGADEGGVVKLGNEALVEVAQAVDLFAVTRFGGNDLDVRFLVREEAANPHQGAGRAQPRYHMGDLGKIFQNLWPGGQIVRLGVGRIPVLIEHHPVRVLGCELFGDTHRLVGATRGRGGNDLCSPHGEQLLALRRGVLRENADKPVARQLGGHRQRDAGVATRRFQDRGTRSKRAVELGGTDHVQRRPVLDGAGRIPILELGPQPYRLTGRQPRQSDERGVADRIGQ